MKLIEKWSSFSGKKRRALSVIGCILLLIFVLELFVWLKIARLSFDKPEPAEDIINVETTKEPTPHSRNALWLGSFSLSHSFIMSFSFSGSFL